MHLEYADWNGYTGWGEWFPRIPMGTTDPDDVTLMMYSAESFLVPTQELNALLKAISQDKPFAHDLKKAAELNKTDEVIKLIKSKGVHTEFNVQVNPDGIRIEFKPDHADACFFIRLSLCW
ncbi:hypothetical protein ACSVDE_03580 [Pseudalkalibacillus sp. Hm43]|uniref:hypothetical protein n=1 Tax=Pseudalkalibacillus sp. Hm43 TaxID=3450742 RepID=UPI003F42079B